MRSDWQTLRWRTDYLVFFVVNGVGVPVSLSKRTVEREWTFARAWLEREIKHGL